MQSRHLTIVVSFLSLLLLAETAAACLGVKRTINISRFHGAMGTGPGGHIGLQHKEVVLTFDDGPVPATTNRVLAALRAECTKATFFVVGTMSRAHSATLQKIARAGHTIGHHTQTHANLRNRSLAAASRDISAGMASVHRGLGPMRGRASKLFRYPYLARSAALDKVVRRHGLLPFSASIMSQDWKKTSGNAMIERVMARLNRQGRGVILLHDLQSRTAAALPALLRRLKREGYKVVHVRTGASRGGVPMAKAAPSKRKKAKSTKRSIKLAKIDKTVTGSIPKKTESRGLLARILASDTASSARKGKRFKATETKSSKKRKALKRSAKKSSKKAKAKTGSKRKLTLQELRRAQSLARSKKLRDKANAHKKTKSKKKSAKKVAKSKRKPTLRELKRKASLARSNKKRAAKKTKRTSLLSRLRKTTKKKS